VRSCFLQGYGPCGGGISREHYISAAVLEAISPNGTIQVGGLPWQPHQQLKQIGIQSFQAKILCRDHNSKLTDLDNIAGSLMRSLDAADKNPAAPPFDTTLDGPSIERWFIKLLCGYLVANKKDVPEAWKNLLMNGSWPENWGMYLPLSCDPQVLATEFYFETHVHPITQVVLAAIFRIAGVNIILLLGNPDHPDAWGLYRPRGIIFRQKNEKRTNLIRRIEFIWPFNTERCVIYDKVGTSKDRPPQWDGWKD
jgi:hypothetical protein